MEAGLTAAFTPEQAVVVGDGHNSVLRMLGQHVDNVPRVALREADEQGGGPIMRPKPPEMPQRESDSRYQLQGEIARGGMGAILKGRDTDLGRDLAIKVLLEQHRDKPEVIERFIEESQIGGQVTVKLRGVLTMLSNAMVLRQVVLGLLKAGACLFIPCSQLGAVERLELEVREVGGFRRHEPVSALLTLPQAVARSTPFRLLSDGAPLVAQFRPTGDGEQTAQWWIDFSTILSPHEERTYVVEYGSDVQIVAEPSNGHVLRETKDAFVIENAPYIAWTVPRDLAGLLRSVDFPPNEHLRPDSPGLVLRDRAGGRHAVGGPGVEARVVRSGTRAVALRFTGEFDRQSFSRRAVDGRFDISVANHLGRGHMHGRRPGGKSGSPGKTLRCWLHFVVERDSGATGINS